MLAVARGWIRGRPGLSVAAYAGVFAAVAFALTRPVLLVNDGHMYFEMARSMRHGTLELDNGLDLVDSPELWIHNAVKIGPHLFSKYPPFYGVLAAVPYELFGVRGLYLLNAIGFVVALVGFHELARRVLGPSRAMVATLLLPFSLPLVPYMLMEIPHLVALAPLVWAVVVWDDARTSSDRARAVRLGVTAGLLAGLAFGVRMQEAVLTLPLVAVGAFHSRHKGAVIGGLAGGLVVCLAAVSAFNLRRFGSVNPFTYGPHEAALGAPLAEESVGFFLRASPIVVGAVAVGVLLAVRRCARASSAALVIAVGAAVLAAVPASREVAMRMIATTASLTLNASIAGAGWSSPDTTFGWIDKALLSSTPFLVLGLVGLVSSTARRAPPLQSALAWMSVALLLFLSVRDPDPRTERGATGFLSLSPRYLIEIMPALYLLAWDRLRSVRLGPTQFVAGAVGGVALFVFMQSTGQDDLVPAKSSLIVTGSIVAAGLLVWVDATRRGAARAMALGLLVALTNGYAAACIFAEDSRCLRGMAAVYERWGDRILAAMPEPRLALVGWHYAKDPVYQVRATRPVIIVDPSVDDAASLPETLDALVARGVTPYYFGLELDRIAPHLDGRYRTVPVLSDPLLWRLDRLGQSPAHRAPGAPADALR
jgi:hypothetical protein